MNWTYSEQISISVFHILLLLMHLSVMSDVFIVGLCRSLFGSFDQFLLFLPYLWLISFSYIVKKYHVELKCHNLWETLYFIIVHYLFHRIGFFFLLIHLIFFFVWLVTEDSDLIAYHLQPFPADSLFFCAALIPVVHLTKSGVVSPWPCGIISF